MNEPLEHGVRAYKRGLCKCAICRAANSARVTAERKARRARLLADPTIRPHGDVGTYLNWGCRCIKCVVEASKDHNDKRMKRGAYKRVWEYARRTPRGPRGPKGQSLRSRRLLYSERPQPQAKPFGRD